jgi:hypothetical protein
MTSSLRNPPPQPPSGAAKAGLTVSKVVAGAGAAATTAVVGSVFGADGTVVGAAVGSIVSAVAAATYERSLDQTRKIVTTRVRRGGEDVEITQVMSTEAIAAEVTQVIPAQRPATGAHPTGSIAPTGSIGPTGSIAPTGSTAPAVRPRRARWPFFAGAAVLIFAVGMLLVTGIEFFTGGPVLSSNQSGTSVGTLLREGPGAQSAPTTEEATPTASATDEAAPTKSASASSTKRSGADARSSGRASASAAPSAIPAPRGNIAPATPTLLPGAQQDG